MSNKLAPPGLSILPITFRYPSQSGPVSAYSVVSIHQGGMVCHLAHGGAYNPLLGWGLLKAHADLLAHETQSLLLAWAQHEKRIITMGFTAADQAKADAAAVQQSEVMQQVQALQAAILESVQTIQRLLKEQAKAIDDAKEAALTPKNGVAHERGEQGLPCEGQE